MMVCASNVSMSVRKIGSDTIAHNFTILNPRCEPSNKTSFLTVTLSNTQGTDRIDASGAAGREEAGEQCNRDQNNQSCAERDWVARAHFIKQVGHQARQQQCRGAADHDSGDG